MRNVWYLIVGIFFGFVLTKGEAISWFRIEEMFRFESFHMFGIFMTAIPTGAFSLLLLRWLGAKTSEGEAILWPEKRYHRGILPGSLIFGFGWALTGVCPGPLYAQIGAGYLVTIVTLISAIAGTFCYGLVQRYLPQ